jgi:predicted DNA-binding protein with PD1-like motif
VRAQELVLTEHGSQYALVFDVGDEVVGDLTDWCNEQRITAARVTGVGGEAQKSISSGTSPATTPCRCSASRALSP